MRSKRFFLRLTAGALLVPFLFIDLAWAEGMTLERPAPEAGEPRPEQPIALEIAVEEAAAYPPDVGFFSPVPESPLSLGNPAPQEPIGTLLETAGDPPPARYPIERETEGIFTLTMDADFKQFLRNMMPDSATTGFEEFLLANVELFATKIRTFEEFASLTDFVLFIPTAGALGILPNLKAVAQNALALGSSEKDDIQGIGFLKDDPRVTRINETFGPLAERFVNPFLFALKESGPLQGQTWFDLGGLKTVGGSDEFLDFIMLQEIGHRWGIHLGSGGRFEEDPLGILGRDFSHWNFFFHGGRSPMDGVEWVDNGDGTFTMRSFFGLLIEESISQGRLIHDFQFNDFDLYAMGFLGPTEVRSSFVIENPRFLDGTLATEAELLQRMNTDSAFVLNPKIRGGKRLVTIQDTIARDGERIPLANASQKDFTAHFVILKGGEETRQSESFRQTLALTQQMSTRLQNAWQKATRNLSKMQVRARPTALQEYQERARGLFQRGMEKASKEEERGRLERTYQDAKPEFPRLRDRIQGLEKVLAPLLRIPDDGSELFVSLRVLRDEAGKIKAEIEGTEIRALEGETALTGARQELEKGEAEFEALLGEISPDGVLPLGFGSRILDLGDRVEQAYQAKIEEARTKDPRSALPRFQDEMSRWEAQARLLEERFRAEDVRLRSVFEQFTQSLHQALEDLQSLAEEKENRLGAVDRERSRILERLELFHAALGPEEDTRRSLDELRSGLTPSPARRENLEQLTRERDRLLKEIQGDAENLRTALRRLLEEFRVELRAEVRNRLAELQSKFPRQGIEGFLRSQFEEEESEVGSQRNRFSEIFQSWIEKIFAPVESFVIERENRADAIFNSFHALSQERERILRDWAESAQEIGRIQNSLRREVLEKDSQELQKRLAEEGSNFESFFQEKSALEEKLGPFRAALSSLDAARRGTIHQDSLEEFAARLQVGREGSALFQEERSHPAILPRLVALEEKGRAGEEEHASFRVFLDRIETRRGVQALFEELVARKEGVEEKWTFLNPLVETERESLRSAEAVLEDRLERFRRVTRGRVAAVDQSRESFEENFSDFTASLTREEDKWGGFRRSLDQVAEQIPELDRKIEDFFSDGLRSRSETIERALNDARALLPATDAIEGSRQQFEESARGGGLLQTRFELLFMEYVKAVRFEVLSWADAVQEELDLEVSSLEELQVRGEEVGQEMGTFPDRLTQRFQQNEEGEIRNPEAVKAFEELDSLQRTLKEFKSQGESLRAKGREIREEVGRVRETGSNLSGMVAWSEDGGIFSESVERFEENLEHSTDPHRRIAEEKRGTGTAAREMRALGGGLQAFQRSLLDLEEGIARFRGRYFPEPLAEKEEPVTDFFSLPFRASGSPIVGSEGVGGERRSALRPLERRPLPKGAGGGGGMIGRRPRAGKERRLQKGSEERKRLRRILRARYIRAKRMKRSSAPLVPAEISVR